MKDVQTYQYYRNSIRIQSAYRVQLEENDVHIEIGKSTGKYTTCENLSTDVITKLKDFLCRNINSFATTIQEFIYSDQYEHCIFIKEARKQSTVRGRSKSPVIPFNQRNHSKSPVANRPSTKKAKKDTMEEETTYQRQLLNQQQL
ncbi:2107_t:CDS:2 [Funneliformis geosporum]|nr:2107_t:CDS:2 [Funneliformis geosporum]